MRYSEKQPQVECIYSNYRQKKKKELKQSFSLALPIMLLDQTFVFCSN